MVIFGLGGILRLVDAGPVSCISCTVQLNKLQNFTPWRNWCVVFGGVMTDEFPPGVTRAAVTRVGRRADAGECGIECQV